MTTPTGTDAASAFFDLEYHRLLAPFHTEAEARSEVAALRELLALDQDQRILDLGCGWGRHARLLEEAGHPVVGLDLSLQLLGRAPIAARVAADMRAVPCRDAAFDVVLNLATSLGLFLDDTHARTALAEVRRVLRPGGRLLLEGMHRDDVVAAFASRDRWLLDDGTEVRARRRFDPLRGVSYEILRWRGPAGRGEKRHALRLRSATETARLLAEAGLTVRAAWGDWDGRRLRRLSPRLILLAERF